MVALSAVSVPSKKNNTLDRHFASGRGVFEKIVRSVWDCSDGWLHGGESDLSTGEPEEAVLHLK